MSSCLHDFELKQRTAKKNLENFSKISVFIKIFSFQDRQIVTFHVITWLNFDLDQKYFTEMSLMDSSKRFRKHTYGNLSRSGNNGKDIRG